jgi:predicted dehydrogenase
VSDEAVRVGVVGVGALGRHHARVWASSPGVHLVGVHDIDASRAEAVAGEFGCPAHAELDRLLDEAQAVSVAVPTVEHHPVGRKALESGCDVLLEKPMATTLAEADDLVGLAHARDAVLQVGHIERFNPATEVLLETVEAPRFIEVHRLGSFSPRSLDVDVVLDLMIHDLDIVLALDGSEPTQIEAVGVPVLTPRVDISNARLRFGSGLIANLTASRVSVEKVRKFRVFAPRTYVSADFAGREAQVFRLEPGEEGRPRIVSEKRGAPDQEPLRRQIDAFLRAVRGRTRPTVPGEEGRRALALALRILARMAEG